MEVQLGNDEIGVFLKGEAYDGYTVDVFGAIYIVNEQENIVDYSAPSYTARLDVQSLTFVSSTRTLRFVLISQYGTRVSTMPIKQ